MVSQSTYKTVYKKLWKSPSVRQQLNLSLIQLARQYSKMYKVVIALALLLATALAMPQFGGHGTLGGGFGQFPAFGGTGSGAGAGTGNAGPGGVSASGVGISSASNGGLATGTGTGTASLNAFSGQASATGQGSGSSVGK